jgi:hypothetical protein
MPVQNARLALLVAGCLAAAARFAAAQGLPSEPIAIADGRVTIGGDVSASFGSADPGFFDYTDYEHSVLRMVRIDVSATVKANEHFSILGDLQTENLGAVHPYALYLRIRPWTTRAVDIQVGRVPPTFGAFARRTYVADNPLIGYPLGYQYLTSIRADALPLNADELLQKRGLGWLLRYSVGDPSSDHGVPLVNAFRWDTGVQLHAALQDRRLSGTVSITSGTISNPRVDDDNGGKQVAGRLEARPIAGLILGTSYARGAFVDDSAVRGALAHGNPIAAGDLTQTAWGADIEYSRDYYLVRAEVIASRWRLPTIAQPAIDAPLRATALSVEGRYKFTPAFYAAVRAGNLGFSDLRGSTVKLPWDAPVTRLEVGGGYSIQRNLLAKLAYQRNDRDGGRFLTQHANHVAAQLVYWF